MTGDRQGWNPDTKVPVLHIQTIVHGDVSRYYYRECTCGFQGPPRERLGDAMNDACPNVPASAGEGGK